MTTEEKINKIYDDVDALLKSGEVSSFVIGIRLSDGVSTNIAGTDFELFGLLGVLTKDVKIDATQIKRQEPT